MPTIPIHVLPKLQAALEADGVAPESYRPAYGGESAGLDLYNAGPKLVVPPTNFLSPVKQMDRPPQNHQELQAYLAQDWLEIPQKERDTVFKTLIPTGLRIALPPYWVGLVFGRGSVSKTPLLYRAGVIDPGYTAEIWVSVINVGPVPFTIDAGAKLPFQLLALQFTSDFTAVSVDAFEAITSGAVRRDGQIGSSDQQHAATVATA